MLNNTRTSPGWVSITRTLRSAVHTLAARYRIVRWLAYVHVSPPGAELGVEVRTETDWEHPDRHVVAAPAGAVALIKLFDDDGTVVDLFLAPVVAFGVERFLEKKIRIRNRHDRDVSESWCTIDAQPVTESETFAEDIVAVAYVLPDGSVLCRDTLYASLAALLDEKRKAIFAAK